MIKLSIEQIQQQITAYSIFSTNGNCISWWYQDTYLFNLLIKENRYLGASIFGFLLVICYISFCIFFCLNCNYEL